ncbi:MAG: helix-turn-helix domain-containing protein [Pseudorhodoplanes sp.]|nr:helix-turn-helix domain-containing protein [Pseudorhodoplanes sp.]
MRTQTAIRTQFPQSSSNAAVRTFVPEQTLFGSIELAGAPMSFTKGAEIYGEDEPSDYVYKIVKGAVRSYRILSDGRRQIEGFYFPGDVFGLEAGDAHGSSAEAVSDSIILVVRRSTILDTAQRDSDVATQLWSCTARELSRARDHALLLVKTAQERVAAFLLDLANRFSGNSVELPMSRQDIADYLGLTIETVSRTLTQFQDNAAIELPTSRRVVLRNRGALHTLNS